MARKRKSKQPQYTYHGQLGIPSTERAQHMPEGYAITQLAAGYSKDGGVIQSKIKTILTHPATLRDLYSTTIQQYQQDNQPLPPRIDVACTVADKITAQHRGILWSYLSAHVEAVRGNIKIVNYSGSSGASAGSRLPLPEREFAGRAWDRRRFYAWVREQTGMAVVTDFLDRIAAHDNPSLDGDGVVTKWDMGRDFLAKEVCCPDCGTCYGPCAPRSGFCRKCGHELRARDRDSENAFYGALALAARTLAEAAHDFVTWENRQRMVAA